MSARELTDRVRIERFLREDAVENAFQLGYLDEAYASLCRWFGWSQDDTLRTVVLVYAGLSRPGLFTSGDFGGIRPILKEFEHQFPERATGHVGRLHLDSVRATYRENGELNRMSRMGLMREDWCDVDPESSAVVRLDHSDTASIMALYAHWPDNFFEPYQLESGLYFGVKLADGRLVSIAGVHNLSERYDIAAIGNLVTHPDHRGHGYARVCTAALLRAAFKRVRQVTLDVQQGNEPAIRTYRHFGFRHFSEFFEGELVRRGGPWSMTDE